MSDPRPLSLVVVSSGLSVPSSTRMLADRLAAATREVLERDGHAVRISVIEVKDLGHDIVDATLTRFANERLQSSIDVLKAADGVIAVTPTFNLSYAGIFKSFVDVVDPGTFTGVPVLLGATGGTARHSLAIDYALRPLFAYLKADTVPTSVFAAAEDFGSATTAKDAASLDERALRAGTELAQYMARFAGITGGAITPTRARTAPAAASPGPAVDQRGRAGALDEFADFVPMGDLLGR
ncbi:CE1759 family FMN reductase [Actinocorallia populi]|uniref:CE1759 family FMN reductase n=1 Tax=Actinocorallia populi TaxID=2079200 RepID=UPI000D08FD8E|nr:CE1759 family FMN reductase [Actinocorallia populi]